jgi:nitrite reductase (NADH) large subunit
LDRDQLICVCQDVTAGEIVDAIRRHGDIDEVKRCTGACVTCLGCEMEVEELFDQYAPGADAAGSGAGILATQGAPA